MPLIPNQFTLMEKSKYYGLHRFEKNGPLYFCRQHDSGDWQQDRLATEHEITYITTHGKPAKDAPAGNGGSK